MYVKDFGGTRGKGQYSTFRYLKLKKKEREIRGKMKYIANSEAWRIRSD